MHPTWYLQPYNLYRSVLSGSSCPTSPPRYNIGMYPTWCNYTRGHTLCATQHSASSSSLHIVKSALEHFSLILSNLCFLHLLAHFPPTAYVSPDVLYLLSCALSHASHSSLDIMAIRILQVCIPPTSARKRWHAFHLVQVYPWAYILYDLATCISCLLSLFLTETCRFSCISGFPWITNYSHSRFHHPIRGFRAFHFLHNLLVSPLN